METELKLRFTTREGYDRLLSRKRLSSMISRNMMAVYYDTPDRRLRREQLSYRIRREGDRYIATIKAKGSAKDGVHRRLEWNIVQKDATPDPSRFLTNELFTTDPVESLRQILTVMGNGPFEERCRTHFIRRTCNVSSPEAVVELCVDDGFLSAGGKTEEIWELELELCSGSEEYLQKMGDFFCKEYDLVPENQSKYARCLALLGE